jgi:hypothetical protein
VHWASYLLGGLSCIPVPAGEEETPAEQLLAQWCRYQVKGISVFTLIPSVYAYAGSIIRKE